MILVFVGLARSEDTEGVSRKVWNGKGVTGQKGAPFGQAAVAVLKQSTPAKNIQSQTENGERMIGSLPAQASNESAAERQSSVHPFIRSFVHPFIRSSVSYWLHPVNAIVCAVDVAPGVTVSGVVPSSSLSILIVGWLHVVWLLSDTLKLAPSTV